MSEKLDSFCETFDIKKYKEYTPEEIEFYKPKKIK